MRIWHTCASNLAHLRHNLAHACHRGRLKMIASTFTSRTTVPTSEGTNMSNSNITRRRPKARRLPQLAVVAITAAHAVAAGAAETAEVVDVAVASYA